MNGIAEFCKTNKGSSDEVISQPQKVEKQI